MWGLVQTPPRPPGLQRVRPTRWQALTGWAVAWVWTGTSPAPPLRSETTVKDLSPLSVCFLICQTEIRPLTETFQPDKVMYNVG